MFHKHILFHTDSQNPGGDGAETGPGESATGSDQAGHAVLQVGPDGWEESQRSLVENCVGGAPGARTLPVQGEERPIYGEITILQYIGNFLSGIFAKMTLGRCVKFSMSPIFAISRTLNADI